MKEIIEKCKCGIFLTINEHRDYYMSVKDRLLELIEQDRIDLEDVDLELENRMIETDSIYELQFYPDTPIGSYTVWGSTYEEVIEKAKGCLLNNQQ